MKSDQSLNPRHYSMWVVAMVVLSVAAPAIAWGPPPPLVYLNVANANPWTVPLHGGFAWPIDIEMTVLERDIIGIGSPVSPPFLPPASGRGYLLFDDEDSCPSFLPFNWEGQEMAYLTEHCPGEELYPVRFPGCTPPDWAWIHSFQWPCPSNAPGANDYEKKLNWDTQLVDVIPWEFDETWLEFSPGIETVSWVGNSDPNKEFGTQEAWAWKANTWQPQYVGPNLGTTTDRISFGASPAIPGLVVLADHGPGLRTIPLSSENQPPDPNPAVRPTPSGWFDPPPKLESWNLAGFVNAVDFTLLSNAAAPVGWGRIKVQAHFSVPRFLFTPVVIIDRWVTNPVDIDGELCGSEFGQSIYRVDGGPLKCADQLGIYYSVDPIINDITVTARVFIVNGEAPDIVEDMDGNGVLDIRDVEAMGFEPLSRQRVFRFRQYHEMVCEHAAPYDFDGDGEPGGCVLGPRSGSITGVPR